jgi:hypothetical protein
VELDDEFDDEPRSTRYLIGCNGNWASHSAPWIICTQLLWVAHWMTA